MQNFRMFGEHRAAALFLVGLTAAAGLSVTLDNGGRLMSGSTRLATLNQSTSELSVAPARALTAQDRRAAEIAWTYIAKNTRPETGLVDSVAEFPSTTLWDQGSYLLALLSAYKIGLIEASEYHARMSHVLETLAGLPLFEGKLPNKVYDTQTLAMVDYQNQPTPEGIGWSALDIARVLSALRAIERATPEYGNTIRDLVARWDLSAMAQDGQLFGATREDGETAYLQEGRIGYEQYAARAAALWGLDALGVISARPFLAWEEVEGIEIPTDLRDHTVFEAITPTLSEPFILQGLELGLDTEGKLLASRVYRAQEARFKETGQLTMVSEDHIDQAPYFLYSTVHSNGEPWAVVNEDGKHFEALRIVSVKSVFAWDALYNTGYTNHLREEIAAIADPERGWPAGIYEQGNTVNAAYSLNTNAIILEAVHFIENGPLWTAG